MESKSGIIYISRIPPHVNPLKIRQIFSRYGRINRVFLQPIDPAKINTTTRKYTNAVKLYNEGWVEFNDRKIAKSVAFSLNNTKIGNKNKSSSGHDLWNLKYLRKFKWSHLNERLAHLSVVKEQRLRTEISYMKKQNATFLDNFDKSRAIDAIITRSKHKNELATKRCFKKRNILKKEIEIKVDSSNNVITADNVLCKIFS